ncbi:MAG: Lsm family RNA-binding protein [Thermoproteota archaeon]|nr:Lsm family RNA-binding protein [Candidatus Brockarchaeota archaeon]MBO3768326.1 Lsm family RNA-binding protein [Candidatus Brockarchaeota archaeon]MBO3800988.1 Lsm family RNA-binding protein [Candidatus Brockarchaeota archaeon]
MIRTRVETELRNFIGKNVTVETSDGKKYKGVLLNFDSSNLTLILGDVELEGGQKYYRIVLNGNLVKALFLPKAIIDLKALADRLERVFPNMVKYNEEAGVIIVLDKIRVDERGVIEGKGLAAERVQKIYEEYIKEMQSTQEETT